MIRCLLVDDEPIALRVLQMHLAKISDVTVLAACSSAMDALAVVRREAIDLVFLDIEMPDLTGLGFVAALERPPRIVFTTAHRHYALEGFELDAVDYLLKPIGFPRLLRAVEKYRALSRVPAALPERADAAPHLHIRVDRRTERLAVADLLFVESLSDYVRMHTRGGTFMPKMRLADLECELAPHGFVRIHRSFLVALGYVESFTASEVRVGGRVLPISRTYRATALQRLERSGRVA